MSVPTKPPIFRTLDWGAFVRQAWGDEFHKPDTAYEFIQRDERFTRRFNDPGSSGGPYTGTSGNG